MSSVSSYSSSLPSVGPPMLGWGGSPSTWRGGIPRKRHQRLGLWSAVALQQHFVTTGGQRGRPLPSTTVRSSREEQVGQHARTPQSSSTPGVEGSTANDSDAAAVSGDLRSLLGPAGNLPGHAHKPTLAQRMGLVPAPPPAPTAEDWQVVVHRAMQRERQSLYGAAAAATSPASSASACSICQMSFLATINEGQVILSCSHVFHAQCFRAFERCVRAQQRADSAGIAEVTAQLACPVCRTQHYYKRVFYEGKAMTQRAAIVKVQSAIRGFLARRRYLQIRLRSNAAFRTQYVQNRLARLSSSWAAFCAQQERQRETTLMALAVLHQAATAAYLTEEEWGEVWRKLVANAGAKCGGSASTSVATEKEGAVLQCPICLERIHETYFTQRLHAQEREMSQAAGTDAVVALRLAYEQRRNAAREGTSTPAMQKLAASDGNKKSIATRSEKRANLARNAKSSKCRSKTVSPPQPLHTQLGKAAAVDFAPPRLPLPSLTCTHTMHQSTAATTGPRSGVLLSCGHCFHNACIGCYERFNEQRMTEEADSNPSGVTTVIVADRCPICRAGYAKHPL
jgi:hypothetical protein